MNKLAKMNDDYEDFKSRSEADYEIILGVARRGLASLKLEHDDRDSLERAIYFLERSFRALAWISDQSNHGKLARQALYEMMGAAFLVGAVGTIQTARFCILAPVRQNARATGR